MAGRGVVSVYSHPRSGTNFAAACLQMNFYPTANLRGRGGRAGHWAARFRIPGYPWARLCGGHGFYREGRGRCVYVYRDGRDVAVSVFRTKGFLHPDWGALTFSEFLRTPLDWKGTPYARVLESSHVAERHKAHLRQTYNLLNLVDLRRQLDALLRQLLATDTLR